MKGFVLNHIKQNIANEFLIKAQRKRKKKKKKKKKKERETVSDVKRRVTDRPLRKHACSNILKILAQKRKFLRKIKYIFHFFLHKSIDLGTR